MMRLDILSLPQPPEPYELRFEMLSEGKPILTVSQNVSTAFFGSPAGLQVLQHPGDAVATEPFPQIPVVAAVDSEGNQVLEWTAEVNVELIEVHQGACVQDCDAGPSLHETCIEYNCSTVEGWRRSTMTHEALANFRNLTIKRVGLYFLNFSSLSLAAVTSRAFRVRPGAPSVLYPQLMSWNLVSMVPIGPLYVSVLDRGGNVVPVDYTIGASLQYVNDYYPPGFNGMDWRDGDGRYALGMHAPSYGSKGALMGVTQAVAVDVAPVRELLPAAAFSEGSVPRKSNFSASRCSFLRKTCVNLGASHLCARPSLVKSASSTSSRKLSTGSSFVILPLLSLYGSNAGFLLQPKCFLSLH